MTSVQLGKKFLLVSAAALLLAACSKDPEPRTTTAGADTGAEQSTNDGRPDAVTTPQLTQQELDAQASAINTVLRPASSIGCLCW